MVPRVQPSPSLRRVTAPALASRHIRPRRRSGRPSRPKPRRRAWRR
jgi:hypothetical protein